MTGMSAAAAISPQIWETRSGKTVSEAVFLDRLAQADVVFLGEQHDDPATHALELDLLRDLHQKAGKRLTLGMEMWERDVQPALDSYLTGKSDEAAFLRVARPWANYRTDYRPLVEYAKAQQIPVIASNAPQDEVRQVGREGLSFLEDKSLATKFRPSLIQAPHDDYWQRFRDTMTTMGSTHGPVPMDEAAIQRFYEAQVVRDETMAESIVQALANNRNRQGRLVLHVNGQFHSDWGGGIPRRVLWRRPLARVMVVSVVSAHGKQPSTPPADRTRADFLVFIQPTGAAETRPD